MRTKAFRVISSVSMVITITAALLSFIGIPITGLYPGIVVLLIIAMIPIASKFYAKRIVNRPDSFRRNYYRTFTIINLLLILIVLWMALVIVHDGVLGECY